MRLAIDDFGTGYSSLAYLRQFPVDTLKIDRSFVNGIATSKESAALIHTLIDLGKTLNLETLSPRGSRIAQLQDSSASTVTPVRASCSPGRSSSRRPTRS